MEGDGSTMDSLFEGMELFIPSQLQPQTQDPPIDVPSQSQPQPQFDDPNPPYSDPLDENLFSDLTLVAPLQSDQLDSSTNIATTIINNDNQSSTSQTVSRQISRKKKRANGLRIGYGRDPSYDDLPTPSFSATNLESPVIDDTSKHSAEEEDRLSEFEVVRAQIAEKLASARQLADSVSLERKEGIRRRRKAADNVDSAAATYAQLEVELNDAIEAEDFEAADRISQSLATAEQERATLLSDLKDAQLHCDAIDAKMRRVLECQIAAERECASLLRHFARAAENNAESLLEKAQTLSSKAQEDCFSSAVTLETKRIELDIESVFVNEARLGLKDAVDQFIQDDTKQKEILYQERETLNDELQKLLALVKLKEMEIAENNAKINAVEESIDNALSNFHDIQSSIDTKYDNLQAGLSEISSQNEALSTQMKEIDESLAGEKISGSKLKELSKISEDEAKEYEAVIELREILKQSILKSWEDKERLAKSEEKLSEDVQMLQQELSSARAHLQELSSSKSSLQQNISSLKQRVIFIDKRIPELEAEKRVAATARNFKEAGRIAAEAKSLTVEKDNVLMDLGKSTSQLKKLEDGVNEVIDKLEKTESLILSKEKEVAMARFQRLLLVAGTATAERAAALELGDTEEASLLLAEAEAATAEAKKLQPMCENENQEFVHLPKHLISLELVTKLGRKQLEELVACFDSSASQSSETK